MKIYSLTRASFGGVLRSKEACREVGSFTWLEDLPRDVRYAFRTLGTSPAFATLAILIIGVGVGASATIFGVVDALWLRPLPFDDPARLVWVANGPSENLSRQTVQVGHVVDLREQS